MLALSFFFNLYLDYVFFIVYTLRASFFVQVLDTPPPSENETDSDYESQKDYLNENDGDKRGDDAPTFFI